MVLVMAVYKNFQMNFAVWKMHVFCPDERLDFNRSGASLATIPSTRNAPTQHGARPVRPFAHFSQLVLLFLAPPDSCQLCHDIDRSGVSLATISLTTSAPMQHGTRPAGSFTHLLFRFVLTILGSACLLSAGLLAGWLDGWRRRKEEGGQGRGAEHREERGRKKGGSRRNLIS